MKNASSGYASLSYEYLNDRAADVVKLEIFVAADVGRLPMIHLTVSPSASPSALLFLIPCSLDSYLLPFYVLKTFEAFEAFVTSRFSD